METGKTEFQKSKRKRLFLAFGFTLALPVGVVMIILGAVNGIWAVMGIGIALAVCGFYGTPLLWVGYAAFAGNESVYRVITEDGLMSVNMICSTLGMKRRSAVRHINYLLSKRYLAGYKFDGNDTVEPLIRKKKVFLGKCPNCGAALTAKDDGLHCPYCGVEFGRI